MHEEHETWNNIRKGKEEQREIEKAIQEGEAKGRAGQKSQETSTHNGKQEWGPDKEAQ